MASESEVIRTSSMTTRHFVKPYFKERDVAWAAYMLGQCHASQEHHELAKQAYRETLQLNKERRG